MLITDLLIHEVFHATPDFLGRAFLKLSATTKDECLHGLSQRILFANLLHRAANPVVVHRRRTMLVLFHPANDIRAGFEVGAKRENLLQTFARDRHHVIAKLIDVTIEIREKGEIERVIPAWDAVGRGDVVERLIIEDDDTCEVKIGKLSERNDVVMRIRCAGLTVHGGEQSSELVRTFDVEWCNHHETRLKRRHVRETKLRLRWEFERKMDQRLLTPVNTTEIKIRIDESNLISNPASD